MSKLEQLQTLIKVVECQGVTSAAKVLNLSAPAVTKQIKALEQQLGIALFDRIGKNLKLTEMGERYYQEAESVLKNLQQLEALIKTGQREVSGLLSVRATQYYAQTRIMPHLPKFLEQYPKLKMKLEVRERLPDFWQDQVDIVYGVITPGQADWVQKAIDTTRYVICASPQYFARYGKPSKIEELKEHRYLTHMGRNPDYAVHLAHRTLMLNPYLWFNHYETLFEGALQGLGLIWVHEHAVSDFLKDGSLVEIFEKHSLRNQNVYLYYQNGQYIDPKIRAFVDFFS